MYREGEILSKVKIIKYAIVLLFIISLGYNYHHYNKKMVIWNNWVQKTNEL